MDHLDLKVGQMFTKDGNGRQNLQRVLISLFQYYFLNLSRICRRNVCNQP